MRLSLPTYYLNYASSIPPFFRFGKRDLSEKRTNFLRNPVFGLVMALIMVYFYRRFSEKSVFHTLIRVVVTVSAILWCSMLSVKYGGCLIFVFAVMWMLRKNPSVRNIAGASAALVCSLSSMFFMASPMGVMTIHFYNGEKGEQNRAVNYLAYPALLLAVWAAGSIFLG